MGATAAFTAGFSAGIAGTRGSPITIFDADFDSGPINTLRVANLDGTNWLFVKLTLRNKRQVVNVVLPGEKLPMVAGESNENDIMSAVAWGATPSEAGTATVAAVIGAQKVA